MLPECIDYTVGSNSIPSRYTGSALSKLSKASFGTRRFCVWDIKQEEYGGGGGEVKNFPYLSLLPCWGAFIRFIQRELFGTCSIVCAARPCQHGTECTENQPSHQPF